MSREPSELSVPTLVKLFDKFNFKSLAEKISPRLAVKLVFKSSFSLAKIAPEFIKELVELIMEFELKNIKELY